MIKYFSQQSLIYLLFILFASRDYHHNITLFLIKFRNNKLPCLSLIKILLGIL